MCHKLVIQTLEDLDHKLLIKELMDKDFNMLIIKELIDKDFNRWTLIMHRYMEICLFLIKQILDKDMVGNKIQTLEDLDHQLVMHLHFPSQTSIIKIFKIFLKGISIFKMIEFHQVIKIKNFNKI